MSRTIVNTKAAPKVAASCTCWWHNVPEFGPNSVPRKRARFICHFSIWSPKRAHFLGTKLGPRKTTKSKQIFTPGLDKKTTLGPLFCTREMIRRQAPQHGRPAPRARTRMWAAPLADLHDCSPSRREEVRKQLCKSTCPRKTSAQCWSLSLERDVRPSRKTTSSALPPSQPHADADQAGSSCMT